jgi:hypothetical protein
MGLWDYETFFSSNHALRFWLMSDVEVGEAGLALSVASYQQPQPNKSTPRLSHLGSLTSTPQLLPGFLVMHY